MKSSNTSAIKFCLIYFYLINLIFLMVYGNETTRRRYKIFDGPDTTRTNSNWRTERWGWTYQNSKMKDDEPDTFYKKSRHSEQDFDFQYTNNNYDGYSVFAKDSSVPWPDIPPSLSDTSNIHSSPSKIVEVFRWSTVDFRFSSLDARQRAIATGKYIQQNSLPLGLDVHKNRVFITLPRWKKGVPASLAVVQQGDQSKSPLLDPYPNWSWHTLGNCNGITSVFRTAVDECNRLWVLDSGTLDIVSKPKQICQPQILIFDLNDDSLIWRYTFPKDQIAHGALLINIVVDVRNGNCENAFAYSSDVFRYGLHVYDFRENHSWRISHPYFYPDPLMAKYEIDGIKFRWTDGIFGLSLSPPHSGEDRILFFHPLSSNREFSVYTSSLQNETISKKDGDIFHIVGEPRRKKYGQASASGMDRNGVMFYNLISLSAIGCWNSNTKIHNQYTNGIIEQNNVTLSFPNDLKLDKATDQSIWILSNRLHKYLYSELSLFEINFRVLKISVRDAIRDTSCELKKQFYFTKKLRKSQCWN